MAHVSKYDLEGKTLKELLTYWTYTLGETNIQPEFDCTEYDKPPVTAAGENFIRTPLKWMNEEGSFDMKINQHPGVGEGFLLYAITPELVKKRILEKIHYS